jgi:hypothetical protein
MVADFGKNVTQRLQDPDDAAPLASQSINPVRVLLSIIWSKIKRLLPKQFPVTLRRLRRSTLQNWNAFVFNSTRWMRVKRSHGRWFL